jgi:hypothetical protein
MEPSFGRGIKKEIEPNLLVRFDIHYNQCSVSKPCIFPAFALTLLQKRPNRCFFNLTYKLHFLAVAVCAEFQLSASFYG